MAVPAQFLHSSCIPAGLRSPSRPTDVVLRELVGDPAKARAELGWAPRTSFEELVRLMVAADLELLAARAPVAAGG